MVIIEASSCSHPSNAAIGVRHGLKLRWLLARDQPGGWGARTGRVRDRAVAFIVRPLSFITATSIYILARVEVAQWLYQHSATKDVPKRGYQPEYALA